MITQQEAADVLLWRDKTGDYSGIVTDRNNRNRPIQGLRAALQSVDPKAEVSQELIPERIPPDLFLWLMARSRNQSKLSPRMKLGGISQMSSTDGKDRSVDVRDGATLERIELAAAIALGVTGFGPAKFGLDDLDIGAHFYLELHPDGGFQAFKASFYDTPSAASGDEMLRMIEDLWIRTLPALRKLYSEDKAWTAGGPARFRKQARDEVAQLLGFSAAVTP